VGDTPPAPEAAGASVGGRLPQPLGPGAKCAEPGCSATFERTHHFQTKCPEHRPAPKGKARSGRGPGRPPKARRDTPPAGVTATPSTAGDLRLIRSNLQGFYVQAGLLASVAGKDAIGRALVGQSEPCADAWVELAKTNPTVRRALLQMTKVSAVGVLVSVHVPIIMAVAADTGLLVPTPAPESVPAGGGPWGANGATG
jgi:hypothetical protein